MNKFTKSGSQMYSVAAQTCEGQQNRHTFCLGNNYCLKKCLANYYVLTDTCPKIMPKVYLQQALLERLEYSCHVLLNWQLDSWKTEVGSIQSCSLFSE